MNDRELLEMAAKAMGLALRYNYIGGRDANQPWDPLTDDGDALRLAVYLGIEIFPDLEVGDVSTAYSYHEDGKLVGNNTYEDFDDHQGDAMSAARWAIVRAAAEIGKAMP